MPEVPVLRKLSVSHSREIGRIIVRWAHLEWRLRLIAYALLGLDQKEGRLAVRATGRVVEFVTMLQDLENAKRFDLGVDWKGLRKVLKHLSEHRGRLAHGLWLRVGRTKSPSIQIVNDVWQPDPKKKPTRAKIDPVSAIVRANDLNFIAQQIDSMIDTLIEIEGRANFLREALLRKSHKL